MVVKSYPRLIGKGIPEEGEIPPGRRSAERRTRYRVSGGGGPLLHLRRFRKGSLGLFLIDHGSIFHIARSWSESRGSADRADTPAGSTVIAMVTVVVVTMSATPRPSLAKPSGQAVGQQLKVVWLSGQYQRAMRVPRGVLRA